MERIVKRDLWSRCDNLSKTFSRICCHSRPPTPGYPRPDVVLKTSDRPVLAGHAHIVWQHRPSLKPQDHKSNDDGEDTTTDSSVRANTVTTITTTTTTSHHVGGDGPKIYLGSAEAAHKHKTPLATLQEAGIGAILNCTKDVPCYHRPHWNNDPHGIDDDGTNRNTKIPIKYAQVAINDVPGADLLTYLPAATAFVRACLTQFHVSVLVHCRAGVSRSASMVLAYLMEYECMTLDEAYVTVKQHRPFIDPNEGFWAQLVAYQNTCLRRRHHQQQQQARSLDGRHRDDTMAMLPIHDSSVESLLSTPKTIKPINFDGDKNNNNNTVGSSWARQSNALYACCRDMGLPENALRDACFGQVCEYYRHHNHHRYHHDHHDRHHKNNSNRINKHDKLDQILFVALDFIWGRGVLAVECDWLAELCRALDRTQEQQQEQQQEQPILSLSSSSTSTTIADQDTSRTMLAATTTRVTGATIRVEQILTDSESDFCSKWTGEIYPHQLGRVFTTLLSVRQEQE